MCAFDSAVTRFTLTARAELDLVPGDRRPAAEPGRLRVHHVELLEHLRQRGDHDVVGLGAGLRRAAQARHGIAGGSVRSKAAAPLSVSCSPGRTGL